MHRQDALSKTPTIMMQQNREEILRLWYSIDKPKEQIDAFVAWLIGTDFFKAPCSTEFHLCVPGGLAQHSLNVFRLLKEKVTRYDLKDVTVTDVVMCCLGHDLCKANFYIPGFKNVKNDATGQWERKSVFKVEDQFPMGHGEKSVSILQDYFQLTEIQKLAIRWHMVAFDPGIHFFYPSGSAFREACKRSPLVTLLFTADYEASQILEVE